MTQLHLGPRMPHPAVVLGMGLLAAGAHMPAEAVYVAPCKPVDDSYTVAEYSTLSGNNVKANDGYVPSNCFATVVTTTSHGTLNLDPGGTFVYVPNNGFVGTDQFVYNLGTSYWPATVSINVTSAPSPAPTASSVTISGSPQVGSSLTGSYTYASAIGAAQGNSTMRWMRGTKADGSDKVAITGATSSAYTPVVADGGNYLFYCVTPVAQTGGATIGAEVCSSGSQIVLVSNITSSTTVTGIGPNQIVPLDLSTGYGPTFAKCLTTTLQQLLGADAVYLGQVSGGGTHMQQGGKIISFYVVRASGDTSQGSGLHLLQSNALNMGTTCGNLDLAPALYNPTEFGAVLAAAGLTASVNTQGVITITGNGSVYVARPDYFVTPGQPAGPSLKQGSDGLYRFMDSAGNSQILRAAFLSADTLQADAGAALGGNLVIQTDGTALFTQFSGPQSVLSPDLVLGGIPAGSATATWWTDGPNHYRFPIGLGASQGLTQTAK